ncbi:MAG: hypothetical protein RL417_1149 [Pseudomonadota bacterium]|jgi:hypothetical protein
MQSIKIIFLSLLAIISSVLPLENASAQAASSGSSGVKDWDIVSEAFKANVELLIQDGFDETQAHEEACEVLKYVIKFRLDEAEIEGLEQHPDPTRTFAMKLFYRANCDPLSN